MRSGKPVKAIISLPGCPNLIERIEGGLFSYGNEMTRETNPLEFGLSKFCTLDGSIDFIGREALQKVARDGVAREIRGVMFDGPACPTCAIPWPVMVGAYQVGQITSGIWSPRLQRNIGLSLIDRAHWDIGTPVEVQYHDGGRRRAGRNERPAICMTPSYGLEKQKFQARKGEKRPQSRLNTAPSSQIEARHNGCRKHQRICQMHRDRQTETAKNDRPTLPRAGPRGGEPSAIIATHAKAALGLVICTVYPRTAYPKGVRLPPARALSVRSDRAAADLNALYASQSKYIPPIILMVVNA